MNTYQYIKHYTDKSIRDNYQISNATIKRSHTNSTYDIVTIVGSDDYPLFNISPVDPKVVFSVGDSVTVLIPVGNKQLTRILGYSNIQFPAEEVIEFNEPEAIKCLYLCYPSENVIRCYSDSGVLTQTISINSPYNIVNIIETCLYVSSYLAFNVNKVNHDGSEAENIVQEVVTGHTSKGLSIDVYGQYLYAGNSYVTS